LELFAKNAFFGHFGDFQPEYGPLNSKRHLQDDSMPFFPPASRFTTFLLGHAQKLNYCEIGFGRESDLHL